ncbi:LEPR-XLL domain-containing protein [Singulisphaera sp. PoT]|uniref:LEPR-XLL domain-containing protein n=1 Tax=Singulisphaera sp. PoT TaxID=3411797 RepID=UPI003BF583D0
MASAWRNLFERASKGHDVVSRSSPRRRLLKLESLEPRLLLAADEVTLDDPTVVVPTEFSLVLPPSSATALTVPLPEFSDPTEVSQVDLPLGKLGLVDLATQSDISGLLPAEGSAILYRTTVPDPAIASSIQISLTWDNANPPADARLWLLDENGQVLASISAARDLIWQIDGFTLAPGSDLYVGVSGSSNEASPYHLEYLEPSDLGGLGGGTPAAPDTGGGGFADDREIVMTTLVGGDDDAAKGEPTLSNNFTPAPLPSPALAMGRQVGPMSGTPAPSLYALPTASLPPVAGKLAHPVQVAPAGSREGVNVDLNMVARSMVPQSSTTSASLIGSSATSSLANSVGASQSSSLGQGGSLWLPRVEIPNGATPTFSARFAGLPHLGAGRGEPVDALKDRRGRSSLAVLPPLLAMEPSQSGRGEIPEALAAADAKRLEDGPGSRETGRTLARSTGTLAALSVSAHLLIGVFYPDLIEFRRRARDLGRVKRRRSR